MIGYDLNGYKIDDALTRSSIQAETPFSLGFSVRSAAIQSLGDGDLEVAKGAKEARPFSLSVMVYATTDTELDARFGSIMALLDQPLLTLGRTIDGVRRVADVDVVSVQDNPEYNVAAKTLKFAVILKLRSVYWRDEAFTTLLLPSMDEYNAPINPSPQLTANGWGRSVGTGGDSTPARVAGVGVGGGYGYQATWTVSTTAPSGNAYFGNGSASNFVPVTAGTVIYPAIHVKPNIAQRFVPRVYFFNDAGALVGGAVSGSESVAIANTFTRYSVGAVTVPAGATRSQVLIDTVSGAGGVNWTGTRTNYCTNPSFENGTNAGWNTFTLGGGGVVTSAIVDPGLGGFAGTKVYRMSVTTAAVSGSINLAAAVASAMPVVTGDPATESVYVRPTVATTFTPSIQFYDTSTTTNVSTVTGAAVVCPANVWTRLSVVNAIAPAGSNLVARLTFYSPAGNFGAGYALDVDACLYEKSAVLGSYFDGSTNDVNLALNSSFETDLTGYTPDANIVLTRTTDTSYVGSGCALATVSVTTGSATKVGFVVATVVGQRYSTSAWIRSASGARQVGMNSTGTNAISVNVFAGTTWQRTSGSFVATSTSTTVYVAVVSAGSVGDAIYIDAVQVETGDLSEWSETGVVVRAYTWTGTANASTSTRSGDTLTVDRVSTAPGEYYDGATVSTGVDVFSWESAAYASRSRRRSLSKPSSLTALADSSGPINDARILVPGAAEPLTAVSVECPNSSSGIRWAAPTVDVGTFLKTVALTTAPTGIKADAAGNIYSVEYQPGRAVKYLPDGTPSTIYTDGTGLFRAQAVAVTATNLYLASYNKIQTYTLAGVLTATRTFASGYISDLTVDSAGYWIIADETGGIRRANATTDVTIIASDENISAHKVFEPHAVAFDSTGALWVGSAGYPNAATKKFTSAWAWVSDVLYGATDVPQGIAFDSSWNRYDVTAGGKVYKYDATTGALINAWGSKGAGTGQIQIPYGIAVDTGKNVWVSDNGGLRLNKYDGDGVFNGITAGQWLVIDVKTRKAKIVTTADFDAAGDAISGIETVPWAGKKLSLRSAPAAGDLFGTKTLTVNVAQSGGGQAQLRAKKALV